jgi:oxygen-dependent protoporphyrinogen oxidase
MKQRIAVIGGGISGMTAAWYLQYWAPELDVHLFDARHRLGGVIE